MSKPQEITQVRLDGKWVPISSPKLDDFCNPDGDLIIPATDDESLCIKGWRDNIRQVPS